MVAWGRIVPAENSSDCFHPTPHDHSSTTRPKQSVPVVPSPKRRDRVAGKREPAIRQQHPDLLDQSGDYATE